MDNNKEEKLQEEQEGILFKFSQNLHDSSQGTNLTREDLEKIAENDHMYFDTNETWGAEALTSVENNKDCIPFKTKKTKEGKDGRKRGRPRNSIKKAPKGRTRGVIKSVKSGGTKEEIDSGFATSSEQLLKSTQETSQKFLPHADKLYSKKDLYIDTLSSGFEGSCKPSESVALLLTNDIITFSDLFLENRNKSELDLKTSQNDKLYPSVTEDRDIMDIGRPRLNKSVQTVYPLSLSEVYMKKSTDLMSSLIKLKHVLSLKRNVTVKNFAEILNKNSHHLKFSTLDKWESMVVEEGEDFPNDGPSFSNAKKENLVSHETINYIFRATNGEYVLLKSVQSILECLKLGLKEDCKNLCNFWHDSASCKAVDVIIQALDSDPGFITNIVSNFLKGIFDEISSPEIAIEDSVKEYKTSFLSNFCKSFPLSFDLAGHVIQNLIKLTGICPARKLEDINEVKSSYFSLRLLEDLLRTLIHNLEVKKIEEISGMKSREVQLGVLNLWKKCWKNPNESSNGGDEKGKYVKYLDAIEDWCTVMDKFLNFCIDEQPLLSSAARKCSMLARDLFCKIQSAIGKKQA